MIDLSVPVFLYAKERTETTTIGPRARPGYGGSDPSKNSGSRTHKKRNHHCWTPSGSGKRSPRSLPLPPGHEPAESATVCRPYPESVDAGYVLDKTNLAVYSHDHMVIVL